MKERYEVDNNLTQEKTEYEKDKLMKKLKLVRNEFKGVGKYGMPLIKRQNIDLDKIELLAFTKTKHNDEEKSKQNNSFFYV